MAMWQVWDPVLIIGQIASIQCLFYLSLGMLLALALGKQRSPHHQTLLHTPASVCSCCWACVCVLAATCRLYDLLYVL